MTDDDGNLDELATRFAETEQSLRSLLTSAERLSTAREELASAREDVERTRSESFQRLEAARASIREQLEAADARGVERLEATVSAVEGRLDQTEREMLSRLDGAERSLDRSQSALADAASGVYGLTSELKDIARDLKDTSIALRALEPATLNHKLDEVRVALSYTGTEVHSLVEPQAALAKSVDALATKQQLLQILLVVALVLIVVVGVIAVVR